MKKTGQEVKWDQIIKGYQYDKGEYVALTDKDFEQANVEAAQSIQILGFCRRRRDQFVARRVPA